jgi:tetratricopeptide (TPR) repeat protein
MRAYDAARKAFREVPESKRPGGNEDYAEAQSRIGLTYHHEARDLRALGKDEAANQFEAKAIAQYTRAFDLNPNDDSPLYNKACSEVATGDLHGALGTLRRSIAVAHDLAKRAPASEKKERLKSLKATIGLLRTDTDLEPLRKQDPRAFQTMIDWSRALRAELGFAWLVATGTAHAERSPRADGPCRR